MAHYQKAHSIKLGGQIMNTKIVIFGNSGSGKSTLAKQLANKYHIHHIDLDSYAWLPTKEGIPPTRTPIKEVRSALNNELAHRQDWVIEGCYSDILSLVMPLASQVYFLNLPTELCVENAKSRPWEPHKYSSKKAQDENLEMLLQWIRQYTQRNDEFSLQQHQKLFDLFKGQKEMFTENSAHSHL